MKAFFAAAFSAARAALLPAAFFVVTSALSAQIREPVRSIRVHGEMVSEGNTLSLSQATKGQDQIRASIDTPNGQSSVTLFFSNKKIHLERQSPGKTSVTELKGEDAAAYLLDLLALNPSYHFRPKNGFDLQHPLFHGYSVRIRRAAESDKSGENQLIRELNLIDSSRQKNPVIRTIRYEDYFPAGEYGRSPRTITFTDNTSGESGIIHLKEHSYNVGIADFLFEPPATTESNR